MKGLVNNIFKTAVEPLRSVRRRQRESQRMASMLHSENARFLKFSPPGHFYSPIPDIEDIHSHSAAIFDQSGKEIAGVELNEAAQLRFAQRFAEIYGEIPFPDAKREGSRYYFDNDYFSYGDGIALYSMMRLFTPARIVEVGSGYSSSAMLDVDDRFFGGRIAFTFIDPYPERLLGLLTDRDRQRCAILQKSVLDVPLEVFRSLEENDILFIDSSHVAKTHSDVLHLLFQVLPALKPGVVIHFHDILWPFEYPAIWLDDGRAWNEAYFLRAFLQYNTAFEILYFNAFMEAHHATLLREHLPGMLKAPSCKVTPGNTSLWLRKAA
ncbi:MAG: class I SAM-dependent methyltransferase [Betaproteobacteria bacterium]